MEHELIKLSIQGDNDAFGELVLRYQNLIFSICLRVTGNSHDAENASQETFIAAYRSLAAFNDGSFKSWLCRIAMNKSIDCKRKMQSTQSREVDIEEHINVLTREDEIQQKLEQSELSEKILGIVSSLSEKYSDVITDHYYLQLPVKEIARKRDLSERTVETRLYRAKKIIKERWGDYG